MIIFISSCLFVAHPRYMFSHLPVLYTPWKMNMEPTNHPFRKEHDLNQTSRIMFHVNF